ncbi:PKD domain-containing protein [Sediminicola sp. YIK13]|uniref:PKD domain-containing protein n=1 Tax=Sediminicola sp. YIK13 TaxID=1453352 RepID=UPI0009E91CBF|nr:PKD domain-containing protein [Sediminicola sp. YIK13]
MGNNYLQRITLFFLPIIFFLGIFGIANTNAQVNFTQGSLDFNGNVGIDRGTSMMFGPDGRLYVVEYKGSIKVFTIQRNGPGDYVVLDTEVLTQVHQIQNHNDDGSLYSGTTREKTGLTVAGTATNPVLYVTSSDVRVGGGSGGGNGDLGLDTNSGVITRFSWNGTSWDVVDLVRGLPRSEENHATNGLEFVSVGGRDYLIVASGGHTNAGAPSKNFAHLTEFALSAAILSVDLTMLNGMPVLNDNGRSYIYDLPTLDDPTRPNVNGITDRDAPGYNGIDVNDPWGGNDGLNQAMVVPGGPVQVFSPGYRNAYDLVVTDGGAVYVTDNGANGGWGGFPMNEGMSGTVTNDYDPSEPGSGSSSGGEAINNEDHLSLVTTDIQNYSFGSFYGGHPNPVRANPTGAGLYTTPSQSGISGAEFRTLIYDPSSPGPGFTDDPSKALPANWPPVQVANPEEGDWRGPGIDNPDGPEDSLVTIWDTNTNGIDEYTATNFNGAMKGNLIAGKSGGILWRVELKADGSLQALTQLANIGGVTTLGVTCNSDSDPFPGTIWAAPFDNTIKVLEPQDIVACLVPGDPGYDASADYDSDGYTNQDEQDNGTDPCNGGSQPNDFDKSAGAPLVSDLNDMDDDDDGISDAMDPFQLGDPNNGGSDAFALPVDNELFNGDGLGGYQGLGLTGLMNNGASGPNWLDWLDDRDNGPNPNDILGGAIGAMTMQMTSGTALGGSNTQEKGFQYGVQVDQNTGVFTVSSAITNFNDPLQLYGNTSAPNGELGIFIGDGTQSNYIKFVITKAGLTAQQEIDDLSQPPITLAIASGNRPNNGSTFYFVVDPSNGEVVLEYAFDGGARALLGTITAQGNVLSAIQQAGTDLAVGMIGTSNAPDVELEGTWDFLRIQNGQPFIAQKLPDMTRNIGSGDYEFNLNEFFGDDGGLGNLVFTVINNTDSRITAFINGSKLTLGFPSIAAVSDITVRATDDDGLFVEQTFTVNVVDAPVVLYRVNSGGSVITAIDDNMDWGVDTPGNLSPYLLEPGTNNISSFPITSYTAEVDQGTTPLAIFQTERSDNLAGTPNMAYSFPVQESGKYEIRLYFGNGWSGTSQPGERIFDVSIEGIIFPKLNNLDLSGTYGHQVGTVIAHIVNVTDGSIDIEFLHDVVQNPIIRGIEILDTFDSQTPIYLDAITDQLSIEGEQLDGSLGITAVGGDGNLEYTALGLPPGVFIEPTNGQIGGTIGTGAALGSPYSVTITVDDSDNETNDAESIVFIWEVLDSAPSGASWFDKDENEGYTERHECSLVQAGDRFYLMGGKESTRTIDIYDYKTDSWTPLVDSAPANLHHFQATEYQGLIWVIGAFDGFGFPSEPPAASIWIFDPSTRLWIKGPDIPANRRRGAAGLVVHNDRFYIVGGNTIGHNGGYVSWFDEYDPATGTWTPLADAPHSRDHFHAAVIGDKLYAAGGRLSGGPEGTFKPLVPEVDVYDFTSGTWGALPSEQNIPTPRGGSATAVFDGKLVVIGGEVFDDMVYGTLTKDALKVTEQYDPSTGTWTRLADMNHERHGTQAIVSGDGIFILAGSHKVGGGTQKNMEYFGTDAPQGAPSIASTLSAPSSLEIGVGSSANFDIGVANGNVGVFVKSMQLSGPNANEFSIVSGGLTNGLIKPNTTHSVTVAFTGNVEGQTATLTLNYGTSSSISISLNSSVNPNTNTSPTAVAGTMSPTSGDAPLSVDFDGSGSNDPEDGTVLSYDWDYGDGVGTSALADPPPYTYNTTGTYNAILTVTDSGGLQDTDNVTIQVNDPNQNGVISFTLVDADLDVDIPETLSNNQQINVSTTQGKTLSIRANTNPATVGSVRLTLSGPVNNGRTENVAPYALLGDSSGNYLGVPFPLGNYTITATAYSGSSLSGTNLGTLSVMFSIVDQGGGNFPPTAVADATSPTSGDAPLSVDFDGSGSNDSEDAASDLIYAWNFGDGVGVSAIADPPPYTYNTPGTYNAILTVTDTGGLQDSDNISIQVNNSNQNAIVSLTLVDADVDMDILNLTNNQQINAASTQGKALSIRANTNPSIVGSVRLSISGPVNNGRTENVAPYALFGDGGGNYSGVPFPLGDYTASATAYSGSNLSGTNLGTMTVPFSIADQGGGNLPPTAVAAATSPTNGDAPLIVDFDGSTSNDPEDEALNLIYAWDFGDGVGTSAVADPSPYTYNTPGNYNAILTVTDTGGLQDSDNINIQVNNPSQNGVLSFTLVDAGQDVDMFNLTNNQQIVETTSQGKTLSIRANTNPATVGSVRLTLSGPVNNGRTENVAPYALFGDSGGNYSGVPFPLGNYTMTATAYSGSNLSGSNLGSLTQTFSIVSTAKGSTDGATTSFDSGNNSKKIHTLRHYPNPSSVRSEIAISDPLLIVKDIYIRDIGGRLVAQFDAGEMKIGEGVYEFNVTGLEDGIYLVSLMNGSAVIMNYKLVVRK